METDYTDSWRCGRAVEGDGLENRCTARYRGFESLHLRQHLILESSVYLILRSLEPWNLTFTKSGGIEMNPNNQLREEFWKSFISYLKDNNFPLKQKTMSYAHARTFSSDRQGTFLSAIAQKRPNYKDASDVYKNELRVELVIESVSNVNIENIESRDDEIQKDFESAVCYKVVEGKRCKVIVRKSVDLSDKYNWKDQFRWLEDNLKRMHKTFHSNIVT